METNTFLGIMFGIILAFGYAAYRMYVKPYDEQEIDSPSIPSVWLPEAPSALFWDTPQHAYHSLRVMCDEAGLTYKQKNILCACVYQESQFLNTAIGRNKDLKTGKVWSTDWGIFQVNDTKGWHIGKGLRFSSVQDVLDHPEKAAKWMIETMETTGKLQPWASYTSGAYKKWLVDNSPMWKLKVV